jgi:serine/threonine protein kinase
MTQAAACERCGAAIMAGARFCASCGADISDQQGNIATSLVPAGGLASTQQIKTALLDELRDFTLGEYEILLELGAGGMASVYLAHDIQLDRKVAIKVMHPQLLQGEGMVERFRLEARTVAGLSHPHIVPIYAVKHADDLFLFIMKFIEGQPLDSIIRKQAPLPHAMVRHILSRVADALGYAHRQGVIHRDIKPANIMVDVEGHPVVTDFGIAKVANTEALTVTGAAIGTPNYMSPEQCHASPLTGSSDQYSLGIMAYEMLTGRLPFGGDNAMTIMYKHVNEPPAPILPQAPDCPAELAAVVEKMLGKKPEDRFANMEDVVRALAAPTMAHDDPVRTQLIRYAMEGENRKLLKRVSTPRSPIPTMPARAPKTPQRTRAAGAAGAEVVASPPPRKTRRPAALFGGLVAAAGLAGALAFFQPWKGKAAATEPESQVPVAANDSLQSVPPAAPAETASSTPAQTTAEPPPQVATDSPPPKPVSKPIQSRDSTQSVRQAPAKTTPAVPRLATTQLVRVTGPASLGVGEPAVLEAVPFDSVGHEVPGRRVDWSSNDSEVVSVNRAGAIVGRRAGKAVITATIDNVSGAIAVTVNAAEQTSVAITPGQLRLDVGGTGTLTATVDGATGRPVSHTIAWSSASPQVASVDAEGRVTAHSPGTTVITATAAGHQASTSVTVVAPGPTDEEVRAELVKTIRSYAAALEAKDVAAVRRVYPGMTSERDQQLRQSLPNFKGLKVNLTVVDIQLGGTEATAVVTGAWDFTLDGKKTELPANNTYTLSRRGGWVITDIR